MSMTPAYQGATNNVTTTFANRMSLNIPDLQSGVFTAYHNTSEFLNRANHARTPIDGYTARFRFQGKFSSVNTHTVGARMVGTSGSPNKATKDITADDRIFVDTFIDWLDYDRQSMEDFQNTTQEQGIILAETLDRNAAIVMALGARASAIYTGGPTGSQITKTGMDVNAALIHTALWEAKNAFDVNMVKGKKRYVGLRPAQFNLLAASMDRLFLRDLGQEGSIGANVVIAGYAGFSEIFMSNNVPNSNIASEPAYSRNTYSGDFTNTVGICFLERESMGHVYLQDKLPQSFGNEPPVANASNEGPASPISFKAINIEDANGTLFVTTHVGGMGYLRPEANIELLTA